MRIFRSLMYLLVFFKRGNVNGSISRRVNMLRQFAPFRLAVRADVVRLYGRYSLGLLVWPFLFVRTFRPVFTMRLCQAASGFPNPLRGVLMFPFNCRRQPVMENVNRAMILAAGEGTRLRPLTLHRPKPMLPVAGRPVLEHIIAWLRYYGITEIVMNLHHCPQMVIDHFNDGAAYGVEIMYSIEEAILGTAGGVRRVADFFEGPFVLVYGDVLTDLNLADLIAFHRRQPARAHLSLSLYHVSNPWACGVVNLDTQGRVTRFVEKPFREDSFSQLANAGVLVMDPAILEHVPDGCCYDFGQDLFPRLLQLAIPMYGWLLPDTAYLIDIGTPENYERVQREWPTLRARAYL